MRELRRPDTYSDRLQSTTDEHKPCPEQERHHSHDFQRDQINAIIVIIAASEEG
jgi:hypothetical protein